MIQQNKKNKKKKYVRIIHRPTTSNKAGASHGPGPVESSQSGPSSSSSSSKQRKSPSDDGGRRTTGHMPCASGPSSGITGEDRVVVNGGAPAGGNGPLGRRDVRCVCRYALWCGVWEVLLLLLLHGVGGG